MANGFSGFLESLGMARKARPSQGGRMAAYDPASDSKPHQITRQMQQERGGPTPMVGLSEQEARTNPWDRQINVDQPVVNPDENRTLIQKGRQFLSDTGDMISQTGRALARDFSKGHQSAREYAKGFDPGDPQSVMEMQKRLNATGAGLSEDGMMGPKTEAALRKLQFTDKFHRGALQKNQAGQGAIETRYDDSLTEADFPEQIQDTSGPVDDRDWNWGSWANRDEYSQGTAGQAEADYERDKKRKWAEEYDFGANAPQGPIYKR